MDGAIRDARLDRAASRRAPLFDYAAPIDPEMSAFGWKFIALSYFAVLAPLLGVFLPRDSPTRWGWFSLIIAFACVTLVLNAIFLRRMVASDGWGEPPGVVVLAESVTATIMTGCVNYALSGAGGFYRPIILIPTVLVTVIGNRLMIAISWLVAMATLIVSTSAQGTDTWHLPAIALSYGATWGTLIVMIHLLSATALRSTQQAQGIADAAAITARADRLGDGIDRLLPVIGAWAVANRVTAYEGNLDGTARVLAQWPPDGPAGPAPTSDELASARREGGAVVLGGRAVIVAEHSDHPGVAVVVEGEERPRLDELSYHFHLQKMALQIDTLLNRSQHIEALESLGRTDSLTGLPNRRSLEERLDIERTIAGRREEPLSLAMIDLDDFKAYNDAHGHQAGDELLQRFAIALRATVRASDFVARYGGEEFCLLLPNTAVSGADALLDQMRSTLRSLPLSDLPAFSAGIAAWDGPESPADLMKRADRALYVAKSRGKNRSVIAGGTVG